MTPSGRTITTGRSLRHWHVHSTMPGYLCEHDSHAPLDARGRDQALREKRDDWRDYAADSPGIVISGSVRSGGFSIDDTDSLAWVRVVESWQCHEAECWEDE